MHHRLVGKRRDGFWRDHIEQVTSWHFWGHELYFSWKARSRFSRSDWRSEPPGSWIRSCLFVLWPEHVDRLVCECNVSHLHYTSDFRSKPREQRSTVCNVAPISVPHASDTLESFDSIRRPSVTIDDFIITTGQMCNSYQPSSSPIFTAANPRQRQLNLASKCNGSLKTRGSLTVRAAFELASDV